MAKTVNGAFNSFLKDTVNLDNEKTKKARKSRDWLVAQINNFPNKDDSFPDLYSEKNIFFGSFARKTKKRPLDDIDLMIVLSANFCTYMEYSDRIEMSVPSNDNFFAKYCFDNSLVLNSKKIINLFLSNLNEIPQYENAEIKRNMEAATLKLVSYEWNFDIVPCFFTKPESNGRTYYIIPDGNGYWKKTDPRLDRDNVIAIGKKHNGKVYNAIRIIKYWNRRPTMPTIPSYLIECMILEYYDSNSSSDYIDLDIKDLITYIKDNIYNSISDPKEIQGNLNTLSSDEKNKIRDRANKDLSKIREARKFEDESNHKDAIKKWGEVFGNNFPTYE